jgi:hypothetical protein
MKGLVAIAALVVVMMGSVLVATTPVASTPRMTAAEATELQSAPIPVYIHFDADDWR